MEALEWNDALATGIKKIDQQHKHLLEIINQVSAAIEHGDSDAAGMALQHMRDYTVYHFSFEEKLLEKAGCGAPPLIAHFSRSLLPTLVARNLWITL